MIDMKTKKQPPSRDGLILLPFILLKLFFSLFPFEYGIFRDEFYYLAMSSRLDFGYLDVPPLSPLLLAGIRNLFGDSYFSLHLLPAICGVLFLCLSYLLVRKMGGNIFSQTLILTTVLFSPYFVAIDSVYTYDTFNKLFWLLCSYLVICLIQSKNTDYWLPIGITVGLGLLSKITIIVLVCAWLTGLLLTDCRQLLFNRKMLGAALSACLIFSPYLFWQTQHNFVTLEYMGNYSGKISEFTFWRYILEQNFYLNPILFPLWFGGLYYLLFHRTGKTYRSIAIAYLFLLIFSFGMKAKPDFIISFYLPLLTAGCLWLEEIIPERRARLFRAGILLAISVPGLLLLPMARPFLPVNDFIRYYGKMSTQKNAERHPLENLPQFYADRFGWQELTEKVSNAYHSLPEADQAKTCIITRNYGEAGAIDYYSKAHALPLPPLSGHNQYHIWGPGKYNGEIIIAVGFSAADLGKSYREVEPAESLVNPYMMPYERANPIYVCRKPFKTFQELDAWFKWLN